MGNTPNFITQYAFKNVWESFSVAWNTCYDVDSQCCSFISVTESVACLTYFRAWFFSSFRIRNESIIWFFIKLVILLIASLALFIAPATNLGSHGLKYRQKWSSYIKIHNFEKYITYHLLILKTNSNQFKILNFLYSSKHINIVLFIKLQNLGNYFSNTEFTVSNLENMCTELYFLNCIFIFLYWFYHYS